MSVIFEVLYVCTAWGSFANMSMSGVTGGGRVGVGVSKPDFL